MRAYATPADLNRPPWNAEADETEALTVIMRATPLLEHLTKTARYATDVDGYPTDPTIIEAFKDAACAQALYFLETGDITGAAARFNSLSLGSFSASGGGTGSATNTSAAEDQYAPEAIRILANAGLIAQAPQ